MNAKYPWIFVALCLFVALFLMTPHPIYAQDDEGGVATQTFTIRNASVQSAQAGPANSNDLCTVTAWLRWYKTKKVKVVYEWQHCPDAPTVYWELSSHKQVSGALPLATNTGLTGVYNEIWPELQTGDRITLRTWINDLSQPEVVTEYREQAPIWTQIHTRKDSGGACFQFVGHIDPWGVFTAGDQSYTFALSTDDWETPWLVGPNQPMVDWHVQFYKDAALTQLRTEYWFNNVANPCYTPPPVSCDNVTLSIPNGALIPEAGADVAVTIQGQHGSQYRIVDKSGQVVAGPSADPHFNLHVLPDMRYQGQLYQENYGWTNSGCQFQYGKTPRPVCNAVTLTPATDTLLPPTGQPVQVTISSENATQYRVVDATGQVVAGPSADALLTFQALPNVAYQAQVYSESYGWTTTGCQFQYSELARPVCNSVLLNPSMDTLLPPTGQQVQVTISGENATQYRVVDATMGQVVAGPSADAVLTFQMLPNVAYQAQVYSESYGWTTTGCQFQYSEIGRPACQSVALNPTTDTLLPPTGQSVEVTINGVNASQYQIVDTTTGQVIAGPSAVPVIQFNALPNVAYGAQVYSATYGWTTSGCLFQYGLAEPPRCAGLTLNPPSESTIPSDGQQVDVTIHGQNASEYRIVNTATGKVEAGPSVSNAFSLFARPRVVYQGQVYQERYGWTTSGCTFFYGEVAVQEPICEKVDLSIPNGTPIPAEGADVVVQITDLNATQRRIVDATGAIVAGPSVERNLSFHALPDILYQAQVADEKGVWTTTGCQFSYPVEHTPPPVCTGVALSVPDGAVIAASGVEVEVTVSGQNATLYQVVDAQGSKMAGPGADPHMHIHAMPNVRYQAQVANADYPWTTTGCDFTYRQVPVAAQAFCELRASHYGDPGGRSRITAWVKDQTTPVAIEKVRINWNQKGDVTYPTERQAGPWFTNTEFTLLSRPEVFDVGFGYYKYEAWVYVAGIAEPAYCWGDGNAPDHDNVLPDPGPFAKPNPQGKLNRGNTPSRLPTVGRLPFDGGNGPDKVELILWAFEKEGRGVNAKITAIANEGKPLARLGMASVSDVAKFDGLNAREGIVYGFQIGEHGPWSPLFCPKADGDPTTITVYWAAGGMTWLSDGNAYGDCWWLTIAAALNGWVTVDERVATYNALQPLIDWNGHRNLVFSLAQSRETGLGPRMQDAVVGLKAREWQGPVLPTTLPADFTQTVEAYRAAQAK